MTLLLVLLNYHLSRSVWVWQDAIIRLRADMRVFFFLSSHHWVRPTSAPYYLLLSHAMTRPDSMFFYPFLNIISFVWH